MRTYKSGSKWGIWRWTTLPNGRDYIDRLHLLKTHWFALCLHWINHKDVEPWPHDHPVSFLSLVLRGQYWEKRMTARGWYRLNRVKWFNYIHTTTRHSIVSVKPGTLTLAIMGPKTQEWGFYTDQGKVYWKDYYKEQR